MKKTLPDADPTHQILHLVFVSVTKQMSQLTTISSIAAQRTQKTPPHSTTPSHSPLLTHRGCHANIFGWAKSGNLLPMTDILQAIYGLEATLGLRTDRNHCVM